VIFCAKEKKKQKEMKSPVVFAICAVRRVRRCSALFASSMKKSLTHEEAQRLETHLMNTHNLYLFVFEWLGHMDQGAQPDGFV
jgi:hypothetical protein